MLLPLAAAAPAGCAAPGRAPRRSARRRRLAADCVFASPRSSSEHPELGRVRDRCWRRSAIAGLDRVRALMAQTIRDQDDDVPVDEVLASFGPLEPGAPLPARSGWRSSRRCASAASCATASTSCRSSSAMRRRWRPARRGCSSPASDVAVRAERRSARRRSSPRVSHALLQEAVGVPTRAGAAGSACPDWTPVIGPERRLAWVCTTDDAPGQRPLLRVHPRRRRVEADADLLAARITAAPPATERRRTRA